MRPGQPTAKNANLPAKHVMCGACHPESVLARTQNRVGCSSVDAPYETQPMLSAFRMSRAPSQWKSCVAGGKRSSKLAERIRAANLAARLEEVGGDISDLKP